MCAKLEMLQTEFPLGPDDSSWAAEGLLLAYSETRQQLSAWQGKLTVDRTEYVELANWPNARPSLVRTITDALRQLDRIAVLCGAVDAVASKGEEAWAAYVKTFSSELTTARDRFAIAVRACDRWLT
jgi:hypothetical protein